MSAVEYLAAVRAALPTLRIIDTPEDLAPYRVNTQGSSREPAGCMLPTDEAQIPELLRLAQQHRTPLYPISQGKNWGLGGRSPVVDGCILLDLSQLRSISDYDPELGTLRVQAGVTFQQVYDFLAVENAPYMIPVIGGSPEASILGNYVERGHGLGPQGDRMAHVSHLKGAWANGMPLQQGSQLLADRYGTGPWPNGLLTQSNLGVLTSATLHLRERPAFFQVFQLVIDPSLGWELIDQVREWMQAGWLQDNTFTLWNYAKTRSVAGPELDNWLPNKTYWMASLSHHAPAATVAMAVREVILPKLQALCVSVETQDTESHPNLWQTKSLGVPDVGNLHSVYAYHHLRPENPQPDRDGCGVLWLCPAAPATGEAASQLHQLVEDIAQSTDYSGQVHVGATLLDPICFRYALSLVYPRSETNDALALQLHDRLLDSLKTAGFPPYRLGIQSMEHHVAQPWEILLKETFDPAGILAPGRYSGVLEYKQQID
ncbi:MAG: FAD-binding oxidoreductase [Bacteroidota bacterium]